MSAPSRRRTKRISTQAVELAIAVPQVVSHRVARMASAGPNPNARDRREFHRMSSEKVAAFSESWTAMTLQMFRANQQLTTSFMGSWWKVWLGGRPSLGRHTKQLQSAALDVVAKGLAPVHKRAVANAKRLGRIKRR